MTAYSDGVLTLNPDAYWPLNDASGNIADVTGNGWTGTAGGTPTYSQTGPTIDSEAQSAILFGTDDRFSVSANVDDGVGSDMTLSLWLASSAATDGYPVAMSTSGSGNRSWEVYWPGDGGIHLYTYQTDGATSESTIQAGFGVHNDGNWHHVVIWRTGGQWYMSRNGGTADTDSTPTGTWKGATTDPFVIGAQSSAGALGFEGSLAHVAYWKSDIGASSRTKLYTGVFTDPPTISWLSRRYG
jgi:hypothetical protein